MIPRALLVRVLSRYCIFWTCSHLGAPGTWPLSHGDCKPIDRQIVSFNKHSPAAGAFADTPGTTTGSAPYCSFVPKEFSVVTCAGHNVHLRVKNCVGPALHLLLQRHCSIAVLVPVLLGVLLEVSLGVSLGREGRWEYRT